MEGALPQDQADLMEEHLVMCDWCKTYLDQVEATVEAIPEAFAPEPVPAQTQDALMTMFREWKTAR